MTTINQLLAATDPLRDETGPPLERRDALRRRLVAAASAGTRGERVMSRRFVVLAGGAAALLGALTTSPVWIRSGATLHAAMQFEVRLAEADPKAGMREAVDTGSGRTIYLNRDVVLTNEDIAETRVVPLPSGFGVEVDFTGAGAAKMRLATTENVGRLLAILVDGTVLAAPSVRSPIDQIGMISGDFTKDEAERLAEGIRRR